MTPTLWSTKSGSKPLLITLVWQSLTDFNNFCTAVTGNEFDYYILF